MNVVLVTIDCLRYDRCGFNGHNIDTTPFLDSIAADSHIFDQAYATGPYTPESFPGILAGLHSPNVAYYDDLIWKAIPEGSQTIAERLHETGYSTAAALSNPHLSANRNFDKGFSEFRNLRVERTGEIADTESSVTSGSPSYIDRLFERVRKPFRRMYRSSSLPASAFTSMAIAHRFRQLRDWPSVDAKDVRAQLERFLPENEKGDPFFAWTHFNDLHAPIHPRVVNETDILRVNRLQQFRCDAHRIADTHEPYYDLLFDSAVSYVDCQIEHLVSTLKSKGLWDETVLIVTADHGEALYDRSVYGHPRHYMYEELLHVPLLVRIPGKEGKRIQAPFSLGWLHELICEVLNLDNGDLPASGRTCSHLDPSDPEKGTVISDSLSRVGHTVSVRSSEWTYVNHYGPSLDESYPDADWPTGLTGAGYHTNDRKERRSVELERVPEEISSIADSHASEPSSLDKLEGSLDPDVEHRLQVLGYKTS